MKKKLPEEYTREEFTLTRKELMIRSLLWGVWFIITLGLFLYLVTHNISREGIRIYNVAILPVGFAIYWGDIFPMLSTIKRISKLHPDWRRDSLWKSNGAVYWPTKRYVIPTVAVVTVVGMFLYISQGGFVKKTEEPSQTTYYTGNFGTFSSESSTLSLRDNQDISSDTSQASLSE